MIILIGYFFIALQDLCVGSHTPFCSPLVTEYIEESLINFRKFVCNSSSFGILCSREQRAVYRQSRRSRFPFRSDLHSVVLLRRILDGGRGKGQGALFTTYRQ